MKNEATGQSTLRSLASWLTDMGVTPVTGWRWRRRGWLKTVVIAGRQYISAEAIADFQRRAEAGEFTSLSPQKQRDASEQRRV